jgi:hypothetical protein
MDGNRSTQEFQSYLYYYSQIHAGRKRIETQRSAKLPPVG